MSNRPMPMFCFMTGLLVLGACFSSATGQDPSEREPRNVDEFNQMFEELSNWGRWGDDDQLGAVNLITPEKRRGAALLVSSGISVSLSHNPMTDEAVDNPAGSFEHTMAENRRSDTLRFRYHGYAVSHIDALCHFQHNGMLFNGVPTSASTADGCGQLGIENLKNGLITRGILLDFPRLKGVPYLDPSTAIYTEDIEAWEAEAGVEVSAGDVIFVYTGRWARRAELGPWEVGDGAAGLHASVVPWIKSRDVAIVGSDAATDVIPSLVDGINLPVHTLVIASLGMNILDNMDLEALAETARSENRWEFMLTVGPIPVSGGTGSPVNALAVF